MFSVSCILMGLLIVIYGSLRGWVIYKKVKIRRRMQESGK